MNRGLHGADGEEIVPPDGAVCSLFVETVGQKYTRSHQAFTNRREHPVGQSFEHRLMLDRYAEYFSNDGKCYWAGQITYRVELSLAFNVVEQLIGKSLNPWSQEID